VIRKELEYIENLCRQARTEIITNHEDLSIEI